MNLMPREKAIGLMWKHAEEKGWDYERLHKEILDTGVVKYPSIACMTGKDMGRILFQWGYSVRVKEPPMIYALLKTCERHNIPWDIVVGTIKHKMGEPKKDGDRDPSVYHLKKREKKKKKHYLWVLLRRVVQFYVDHPEKIHRERIKDDEYCKEIIRHTEDGEV